MRIVVQYSISTFVHPLGHYNIIKGPCRNVEVPTFQKKRNNIVPGPRGLTGGRFVVSTLATRFKIFTPSLCFMDYDFFAKLL